MNSSKITEMFKVIANLLIFSLRPYLPKLNISAFYLDQMANYTPGEINLHNSNDDFQLRVCLIFKTHNERVVRYPSSPNAH